jgi:hypothetical protein
MTNEGGRRDEELALAALPGPPIDADFSARTLWRARGELRARGEGTVCLAGLLARVGPSAVLEIVLTGATYGALAIACMIGIFVG